MSDDPRRQWKEGKTLGEIAGNPDGTFNGVKAMSAISGLDQAEIAWTFNRARELVQQGVPRDERAAILKREVKGKPWLNPEQPPKPG